MIFNSQLKQVIHVPQTFSELEIKNETMLFSADWDFARKNGDALTNLFLDHVDSWNPEVSKVPVVIDSRVHMLMPGWYPCIPGWHHDDVPRKGRFGQPNYEDPEYYSEHLMMLINGNICPTEFLTSPIELSTPKKGIVYEDWNKKINLRHRETHLLKDSTIYRFTWQDFHRGNPAGANGWRYFIRMSRYWKDWSMQTPDFSRVQRRTNKNQVRRQVQVYLSAIEKGW